MCGLTGYLLKQNISANHVEHISRMLELQAHRGPDDKGLVHLAFGSAASSYTTVSEAEANQANLHFGFNRLSILDLSSMGHQPMFDSKQEVVLMMNGEIYNAFTYKPELEARGFQFRSTTDTEVVLNLYLAYGFDEMIRKLNGMFGIVLFDSRIQKLFLARDRFGIKPLYVFNNSKYFAFSSELKSFSALPDFRFELDSNGLDEYMLFRNRINQTLFRGIENLVPGTYLEMSGDFELKQTVFYSLNALEGNLSVSEAELSDWLETAVKFQLMSDVKLGCQLSGGVDSSLVSYFAAKNLPSGRLETISIVFQEAGFSEKKYIDQVVNRLNLLSHQYTLNANLFLESFTKASWHLEQPLNHPNTIGIYELSKQARNHVTVLLSGEGADELFGGYSRFWLNQQLLHQVKYLTKNASHSAQLLPFLMSSGGRSVLGGSFGSISSAYQVFPQFNFKNAVGKRIGIFENLNGDSFQKQRKFELLTFLPDLLMRQDKMSMAWHIENRVPFLDNELVEKGLQIRQSQLIKKVQGKMEGKHLLKELCASNFSRDFAYREKMGFTIPLKQFFLSKAFKDLWLDSILPGIKQRDLFSAKEAERLGNTLATLNPGQLDAFWQLVAFETWAQLYSV